MEHLSLRISPALSNRLDLLSKYRGMPLPALAEELLAKACQVAVAELPPEISQAIETLASETASQRTARSANGADTLVEYTAARLRFLKSRIEKLQPGGKLRIRVPGQGIFEFTREDFETDFRNVIESRSYQESGYYHYATVPAKALKYRLSA